MPKISIVTETRQESRTYKGLNAEPTTINAEPTTITDNRHTTMLEYDDITDVIDLASVLMPSPQSSAPDFLGLVINSLPVGSEQFVPGGGVLTGRRPW